MTICSSPISAQASARFCGSLGSTLRGMPVLTLQKAQARVHTSPRIITVACFLVQHSPIFGQAARSEEHTSELQSLMRISYAVFCLKKKKKKQTRTADTTLVITTKRIPYLT